MSGRASPRQGTTYDGEAMGTETDQRKPAIAMLRMEATRLVSAARTQIHGTRARLDAAGVPVRAQIYSGASAEGVVDKMRRLLKLVRAARKAAHPGVLVTRWHRFLSFVAPKWHRKGGKTLLLVQGNDDSTYETNPWLRKVPGIRSRMTESLRAGDSALCVSQGLADWFRAERAGLPDVPVAVMPSGVSGLFFDAEPASIGSPYVLFCGGLAPWQGIDYMLEVHHSQKRPSGLNLLVIDDGAKASDVDAAQNATLDWLGPKQPTELAKHVAGALVTLCQKANTGSMARIITPFKMLKPVAAGVPVIATDIPAQVDILEGGEYGLLVDAERPEALAEAVASIADDSRLREELIAKARAFAPKCRWTYAAPQLAAAIDSLQAEIRG